MKIDELRKLLDEAEVKGIKDVAISTYDSYYGVELKEDIDYTTSDELKAKITKEFNESKFIQNKFGYLDDYLKHTDIYKCRENTLVLS